MIDMQVLNRHHKAAVYQYGNNCEIRMHPKMYRDYLAFVTPAVMKVPDDMNLMFKQSLVVADPSVCSELGFSFQRFQDAVI